MKILLAIFLSIGCLVPLSAQEPMSMDSSVVNIGTISEDDPPAEAVFRFRNSGPDTLRILQLLTTCGCVRSSWTAAPVLPGACSSFSLSFAPEGHPGPVDRPVYVYYRAGDRSLMKEVRITGHVERSSDRFIRYRYRCGALRLMQDKVKMGQVGQSRRRVSRIAAGNGGCRPLSVSAGRLPGFMDFGTEPVTIPPGGTADLVFSLDARKAGGPGHMEFPVVLIVDDGVSKEKMTVTVTADIAAD